MTGMQVNRGWKPRRNPTMYKLPPVYQARNRLECTYTGMYTNWNANLYVLKTVANMINPIIAEMYQLPRNTRLECKFINLTSPNNYEIFQLPRTPRPEYTADWNVNLLT